MGKQGKAKPSGLSGGGKGSLRREFKRNRFLYMMTVPGILFILIFSYIPMAGLIMAFQDVSVMKGPFGSKFIGLTNFKFIFSASIWPEVLRAVINTLKLNIIFMATGTIFSVGIAVLFSEINNKVFKRVTQSVSILPYFISWAVISVFLNTFINADNGVITMALRNHGVDVSFYQDAGLWPAMLTFLKIWQGGGYGAIVYIATITGIDPGIMEAAEIDGANRWQRIWHIVLPVLRPTVILMTIFNIGRIFYGDFGMIYALVQDNALLYPTTDVVDTYVFRMMRNLQDYGLSTAIGMVQSIAGCILVISANAVARKFEPDSAVF